MAERKMYEVAATKVSPMRVAASTVMYALRLQRYLIALMLLQCLWTDHGKPETTGIFLPFVQLAPPGPVSLRPTDCELALLPLSATATAVPVAATFGSSLLPFAASWASMPALNG